MRRDQKLGVMCADAGCLNDDMLAACGVTPAMRERLVVAEAKDKEEFSHIKAGKGGLDYEKLGDELSGLAHDLLARDPSIGALLLECTDMPPYAHRIQAEQNLPVYDAITLIKLVKNTVTQMPYYGFL